MYINARTNLIYIACALYKLSKSAWYNKKNEKMFTNSQMLWCRLFTEKPQNIKPNKKQIKFCLIFQRSIRNVEETYRYFSNFIGHCLDGHSQKMRNVLKLVQKQFIVRQNLNSSFWYFCSHRSVTLEIFGNSVRLGEQIFRNSVTLG